MAKKITIDVLAQLVEERAQGIEGKIGTLEKRVVSLIESVLDVVKNIDEKMGDIKASTASALEVANIELRMDAMERDIKKMKEKVKV